MSDEQTRNVDNASDDATEEVAVNVDIEGLEDSEVAEGVTEDASNEDSEKESSSEKPKLVLKRVNEAPSLPLKVVMARQASEFYTQAEFPGLESLTKPYNYVLQRDGVWEVRNVQAGWLIRKRDKFDKPLPGFVEHNAKDRGIPRYGKVPSELYWQIVAFFKSICDESKDEVYIQTFWDPDNHKYFNHVPEQIVSGASVRYERNQELEERCPLVVETHSHNTMGAFFSGTDNADEKSDRFFGVMGKLNTGTPEVKYSFLCGGVRTIIEKEDIFDLDVNNTFPEEWRGNVTKASSQRALPSPPYGHYAGQGWTGQGSTYGRGSQGWAERSSLTGRAHSYGGSAASSGTKSGSAKKTKEIREEVEKAAAQAQTEVDRELSRDDFLVEVPELSSDNEFPGTGDPRVPFFRVSSGDYLAETNTLMDTVADIIVDLSARGAIMETKDKEELFVSLVECLSDEDATVLAGVMADYGHGEVMIQALETPVEDDTDYVVPA